MSGLSCIVLRTYVEVEAMPAHEHTHAYAYIYMIVTSEPYKYTDIHTSLLFTSCTDVGAKDTTYKCVAMYTHV